MTLQNISLLKQLLATPAPTGDETAAAKLWRQAAKSIADRIYTDVQGNSYALLQSKPDAPRVLLAGHIDEIGVMVHYIDDDGFLFFQPIGGWDTQVLVGQRVRLLGKHGDVIGVIGKKPLHLLSNDEMHTASSYRNLWIDIGVQSRHEALKHLRIGCVGVLDGPMYDMPNHRIVSRSLDNRVGAFIVLEALRRLAIQRPIANVAAVATTQEETTSGGAAVASFRFDPHVALVVDVTYATDHPDVEKRHYGNVYLGGGVVLVRGAANSPLVYDRLLSLAEQERIPYCLQPASRYLGTDADIISIARSGVATGTVAIPIRYLHTPNEMIDIADVEQAINLIVLFVSSLTSPTEFIPAV
jgi:endoglucanase